MDPFLRLYLMSCFHISISRTEDPRTKQQYAVSQLDAIRNKARDGELAIKQRDDWQGMDGLLCVAGMMNLIVMTGIIPENSRKFSTSKYLKENEGKSEGRTKDHWIVLGHHFYRFGIEARAVLAWFDEYREKAAEYPAMTWVGVEPQGESYSSKSAV